MIDTLRMPFYNDEKTVGSAYFSALESTGLSYFVENDIEYFYCVWKREMDARAKNETVEYGPSDFVQGCHIPL